MRKFIIAAFTVVLAVVAFSSASPDERIPPKKEAPLPVDKRGVSYSFEQDKTPAEDMALLAPGGDVPGIKWFYNWYVRPEAVAWEAAQEHKVFFYPMIWNGPFDKDEREEALVRFLEANPECEWIMGFNEPNLKDQANYTPKQAAKHWPKLIKIAKKYNLKVLSPAMNYGWGVGVIPDKRNPDVNKDDGYWSAWRWLDEFFGIDHVDENSGQLLKNKGFKGVSLNDIDAIAIHSYMPDAGALKWFVSQFRKYNKPIWLTEFCSWEYSQPNAAWQNLEYQMMFMSEAIPYLEMDPTIEKYAWFIPKGSEDEHVIPANKLLTKGPNPQLTPLGIVFVNMGTCDKTKWIPAGERIVAAHFSDMIFSEYIFKLDEPNWPRKEQGFTKNSGVHFRPGTDPTGEALDMFDFTRMKWVEYQVETPEAKTYTLSLRNTAEEATNIEILVNGESAATVSLRPTSAWTTTTVPLRLEAGRHQLRLKVVDGDCALNWLQLN